LGGIASLAWHLQRPTRRAGHRHSLPERKLGDDQAGPLPPNAGARVCCPDRVIDEMTGLGAPEAWPGSRGSLPDPGLRYGKKAGFGLFPKARSNLHDWVERVRSLHRSRWAGIST
jgi:hypothetical protein